MRVVAEGVENERSFNLLREMQCDNIQGYYLCKPVGPDQLTQWIKSYEETT
jgi:EAL domain-containing protein (putative c-di-GMP-specific phosphodiesterase class I)